MKMKKRIEKVWSSSVKESEYATNVPIIKPPAIQIS